ncbi:MAG: BamA/TamA family outer membrane protein [Bacteroidales bacterium]|nr:BamA/TamA family outer membrane protein [Bacteroidales bacterium]MCI1785381.1 BamA/TamA family outer membrane protein [Bacteroidales bacterium]
MKIHLMRTGLLFSILFLSLVQFPVFAQQDEGVEVDYNSPKTYVIGGVSVSGNHYFGSQQIIMLSRLQKGNKVTVPGDDLSSIVTRLWRQKYFQSVSVTIDSLSSDRDSAFFTIHIKEKPRVSRWTFTGVRNGEKKDLMERLNLKRSGEFSDYVSKASTDIIKRYYKGKGFKLVKVDVSAVKDSIIRNAIIVNFAVTRGPRVRIKDINFIGNKDVSDFKLAKSMKKTKSAKIYNFFSSKKFNDKEFVNDKKNLISTFNEAGYRDARLVRDSIYYVKPKRLGIDFVFDEGHKYYFRNITWTGNSVYSSDELNNILLIKKGDVYDVVTMDKRLQGGGKQNEYDVSKMYRDNGYLFFNVTPVEVNIQNDSVDVEMRISEGKQATLNNIIINGNDLTNERVVRRQLFTRPGYLFSQSDFERSIREIASLGQFDPEAITDPAKGYSIIPNQLNSTVDIVYNVTEKPSSQLELSGGWGGNTFVGTVGINFNNFSTKRIFDKSAWRPVPLGDAQTLSLKFQTSGTYYTALSAGFTEPWLFGKKPTSLSISLYYTRQTDSYLVYNIKSHDKMFDVYGLSAGIGNRLKWPDSYFVLYNGFSWETYKLTNWYSNYFIFDDGISHNFSYTLSLSRNSTDQQIYPRQGSDITMSLQLTPPYSLFRRKDKGNLDADGKPVKVSSYKDIDYDTWDAEDRYKWIEYHKWKFNASVYTKLIGDLVLMSRVQFGYLGYYNKKWGYSPFEGFLLGGDGMSGYSTYGSEVIGLRGYENYSLTPVKATSYSSGGSAYAGNVYDKFTFELRYPVVLQPQSTIFVLGFLEGGNCWSDINKFNPFQIKRAAGVGVRVYLPVVGLLGVDWGYGFDDSTNGKGQFHFIIGQQF